MNDTAIEWTDKTWNPITGCKGTCDYCYARRMFRRNGWDFEPTFYEKRLAYPQKVKTSCKVFVCSVADLFGEWVPEDQIYAVLSAMQQAPWHSYQLLTKNPSRMAGMSPYPGNVWAGFTATDGTMLEAGLEAMKDCRSSVRFVSMEPLMEPADIPDWADEVLDWVIVGKLTGCGYVTSEFPYWVENIVKWGAAHNIPVFVKDNVGESFPQQMPGENLCLM